MARYTGPKDRQSRREGFDLYGKGGKLTRLNVPPGMHGPKGTRRMSDYGRQLREKQKVKKMYGLLERQFKRYADQALRTRGNTAEKLFSLLETRLDNVLYRAGFASTRPAARQLVSHKHVMVDGKVVNIPSYKVRPDEQISLDSKAVKIPAVKRLLEDEDYTPPDWLKRKASVVKIARQPTLEDISEPVSVQDIIEFYSR
jgi:small subunit ribosomal protein S4